MTIEKTERGFDIVLFEDIYAHTCSIQKSSLATDDAIWIGILDAEPKILASKAKEHNIKTDEKTGWIPFQISEDVLLTTRMHLDRTQVAVLIPMLQHFVDTGEIR